MRAEDLVFKEPLWEDIYHHYRDHPNCQDLRVRGEEEVEVGEDEGKDKRKIRVKALYPTYLTDRTCSTCSGGSLIGNSMSKRKR